MKWICIFIAATVTTANFTRAAHCQDDSPLSKQSPTTFAIETFVDRTYNYLDRMVDKDGLPYFDIFWTDPAEAAHDWPDFGDVTSRQLQGAIMARHLTGRESTNEKVWMKMVLSRLDPKTGLLVRPKTSYCEPGPIAGDQALTLYTLATAYADIKDPALRDGHRQNGRPSAGRWRSGVHHQEPDDLGAADRFACCPGAGKAAGPRRVRRRSEFHARQQNRQIGHIHGSLRTLVGAADYALYVKDPVLFSRVDAIYRSHAIEGNAVRLSPGGDGPQRRHHFLRDLRPDGLRRAGLDAGQQRPSRVLGRRRANAQKPVWWKARSSDGSWLKPGTKPDTYQFSWRDIGARMVGGYAGWSSPDAFPRRP